MYAKRTIDDVHDTKSMVPVPSKKAKEDSFYLRYEAGVGDDWAKLVTVIISQDGTLWFKGGHIDHTKVIASCPGNFLNVVKDIVKDSGVLDLEPSTWHPKAHHKQEVVVHLNGKSFKCTTCKLGTPVRPRISLTPHETCFYELGERLTSLVSEMWAPSGWDPDEYPDDPVEGYDFTGGYAEQFAFKNVRVWKRDFVEPLNPFAEFFVVTILECTVVDGAITLNLTTCAGETFQISASVKDSVRDVASKITGEISAQRGPLELMLLGPDGEQVDDAAFQALHSHSR